MACKTLVHALVIAPLDYGNAVGFTDRLLHRLEMIKHSAARIVVCIKRHHRQSITAVVRQLVRPTLGTRDVAYQLHDSSTHYAM